ncbi:hypothetical protein [Haloarchaeobius iranensis]|uniref:Uncharacterized protein n=1 Tax=Haloarchaeobius iranensis TaxID=996166 RepID=A0A1G9XST0_9EURY|nr:hypothetical protein [Haloarchaeobius iranensis]SDM99466.1 hypothetical protein SAMN05192554_111106 [Haloarchaeobius iranensis]
MRQRYLLLLIGLVLALLALGALPSLLASGDPYYVTATEADTDHAAVDVSNFSAQQYPYLFAALSDGRSGSYYEGPVGIKGAFTHSPFDEFGALRTRSPDAVEGDVAYVQHNGTVYRLELARETDE